MDMKTKHNKETRIPVTCLKTHIRYSLFVLQDVLSLFGKTSVFKQCPLSILYDIYRQLQMTYEELHVAFT